MPFSNSSPSSQRKPTKKSSFLSLRREKKSPDTNSSSPSPNLSSGRIHTGIQSTSPSSFQPCDFDELSRPQISRPTLLAGHRSRSTSKSISSFKDESLVKRSGSGKDRQERIKSPELEGSYDFPSVGEERFPWTESDDGKFPWARTRSRTGPSGKREMEHVPFLTRPVKYPYRDSGSSSLSQFEPPPQTPVDDMSFRDPIFSIPVMVAAPVSGVETMDALVDGMNGFGSDDNLIGLGSVSSRSKISKSGFHPLYYPPLPTPPPGITLGGALPRKAPKHRDSSSDDESHRRSSNGRSLRHKSHRPGSSRTASNITVTKSNIRSSPYRESHSSCSGSSSEDEVTDLAPEPPVRTPPESRVQTLTHSKAVAPSISEIIRAHAPPSQQVRSKPSLSRRTSYAQSNGHSTAHESLVELSPEPLPTDEENDLISRSSVDTIAEEVRQTLRNQARSSVNSQVFRLPANFPHTSPSLTHENVRSFPSPKSESRRDSYSIYSYSTVSDQPPLPPLDLSSLTKAAINSPSQTIAQYLRSSRLTTLQKLTRSPHASRETPLTVSLSDLGSPTGIPLVVFLGLGCVRHIMGLYDEMAECLGVRLITIDRWGLGRTDVPRSKSAKGIPEWASAVEEVLDRLNIDQCSVMAHSAGAPYALAFANRYPERIRGDVCLLAPWVGGSEGGGYKWLKYVPNGILKTAQAAEWKVQAWMLGKPPTIAYEGIGFDVKSSSASPNKAFTLSRPVTSPVASPHETSAHLALVEDEPRPSMSSGVFSDYDDLRDFDGRFESRSTLGRRSSGSQRSRTVSESKRSLQLPATRRKPSKGFLGRLKGGTSPSQPQSPSEDRPSSSGTGSGKRLKALRSMGSLKGRSASAPSSSSKKSFSTPTRPPSLPHPQSPEVGLGLDDLDWTGTIRPKSLSAPLPKSSKIGDISLDLSLDSPPSHSRAGGRRSISFGPSKAPVPPVPPLPSSLPSTPIQDHTPDSEGSYQAALGNALIAASHAESSKGTHGDLVQILNHDRQPWGFSYSAYPHNVRVWYGEKDERIAENVVRWMESTMGQDKCLVNVVKGADHALMFKSAVVVEVMEYISECWRFD